MCFLSVVLIILKLIKTFMHFLEEVSSQVGIASQTKRPHSKLLLPHLSSAGNCVYVFLLPVCRTPPLVTKHPQQRPPKGAVNWEVKSSKLETRTRRASHVNHLLHYRSTFACRNIQSFHKGSTHYNLQEGRITLRQFLFLRGEMWNQGARVDWPWDNKGKEPNKKNRTPKVPDV